jgi:SsrA-binding protein
MDIRPYQPGNISEGTDTSRLRKLLLNKKEIVEMAKKIESDRLSLIPLELYEKGNRIKVKIGLGLPRNRSDKREAIKKKDISRELGKRIK